MRYINPLCNQIIDGGIMGGNQKIDGFFMPAIQAADSSAVSLHRKLARCDAIIAIVLRWIALIRDKLPGRGMNISGRWAMIR